MNLITLKKVTKYKFKQFYKKNHKWKQYYLDEHKTQVLGILPLVGY